MSINSPNMNLPVPVSQVEAGPAWATDIQNSLNIVDSHDHSPGHGVPINSNGINLNADLTFNSNSVTNLLSANYIQSNLASVTSLNTIFVSNTGELYYNDGAGNQVKLTNMGSPAGATGTITGLPSGTASASYLSVPKSFVFQSSTGVGANIDGATLIIRYPGFYPTPSGTSAISIQAPSSSFPSYAITLPSAPPSTQRVLVMDSSGNITADSASALDNSGNLSLGVGSADIRVIVNGGSGSGQGGAFQTDRASIQNSFFGDAAVFNSNTNTGTAVAATNSLLLYTNSTLALTIDTSQNVGIGSAPTSSKLTINSGATAQTQQLVSSSTATYSANATNGTNARLLLQGGNASGAINGIEFSQGGSSELFFGQVREAGGAGAFVWQGYTGSAYIEKMRLDSAGNLTTTGTLTATGTVTNSALGLGVVHSSSGGVLSSSTIVAADIAANAVTTAKILDNNVTLPKLQTRAVIASQSSGPYVNSGASGWVIANNGTSNIFATITVTGKPVYIGFTPDGDTTINGTLGSARGSSSCRSGFRIDRFDGVSTVTIASFELNTSLAGVTNSTLKVPCGTVWAVDTGATAGTYNYNLMTNNYNGAGQDTTVTNVRIIAYEWA